MVLMSSTQSGKTLYAYAKMLGLTNYGLQNFYILPTLNVRNRYVSNRIDRQKKNIPYLEGRIGISDNKSFKIINDCANAFVGANSSDDFTEFPADHVIYDEYDRALLQNEENIHMAVERLANSDYRLQTWISQPTVVGFGIDLEYSKSDRRKWNFRCQHGCLTRSKETHYIQPDFFKHVVHEESESVRDREWRPGKELRLICDNCHKPVQRFSKGLWIPEFPSRDLRGYHISRLFTSRVTIAELVQRWDDGKADPVIKQRFYNGDLGLPLSLDGTSITKDIMDSCSRADYALAGTHAGPTVMGIDPGGRIHYSIWYPRGEKMVLVAAGWVNRSAELHAIIKQYRVGMIGIDAGPELDMVKGIMSRYRNCVRVQYMSGSQEQTETAQAMHNTKYDNRARKAVVNRTYFMDKIKTEYMMRRVVLPHHAGKLDGGDFYSHMEAPKRIWHKERKCYVWMEGSARDDYYHTHVYAWIARNLLAQMMNRL